MSNKDAASQHKESAPVKPKGSVTAGRRGFTHDKRKLISALRAEKDAGISGGIYHKLQVEFTYNSNHIEGSTLTHDQTIHIFETNTIMPNKSLRVDDVVETANHFRCIDIVLDNIERTLSENFIKKLHLTLKNGTADSRLEWFAVGDYKKIPNEVGGEPTILPDKVASAVRKLLLKYNEKNKHSFEEIVKFHRDFEVIHPFQDGNGRVGRLIMLKECLRSSITPIIIDEQHKLFYYRGLREWKNEHGYLLDTCRSAQDKFQGYMDYFKVEN